MATLSTTAWVLHELGLAAGFGGSLFGTIALDPKLMKLASRRERGRVEREAWERYKLVNVVSLGSMAMTWLVGHTLVTGRDARRGTRRLVLAKDGLVLGGVASGVTAMVAGALLERELDMPLITAPTRSIVVHEIPPSARASHLRDVARTASHANLLFSAAVLAMTTVLALRATRPTVGSALGDLFA